MKNTKRIFGELLAPPFLAAIWLAIFGSHESEKLSDFLIGIPLLVMFSYIFGIVPACVYTVSMELWFHFGLRTRCGLLGTVVFSAFLGALAGFLSAGIGAFLGFLIWPDCIHFLWIGASIGLLVGLCVGWRPTTAG